SLSRLGIWIVFLQILAGFGPRLVRLGNRVVANRLFLAEDRPSPAGREFLDWIDVVFAGPGDTVHLGGRKLDVATIANHCMARQPGVSVFRSLFELRIVRNAWIDEKARTCEPG